MNPEYIAYRQLAPKIENLAMTRPGFMGALQRFVDEQLQNTNDSAPLTEQETEMCRLRGIDVGVASRAKALMKKQRSGETAPAIPGFTEAESEVVHRLGLNPVIALRAKAQIQERRQKGATAL
jgi:hypothetical protein